MTPIAADLRTVLTRALERFAASGCACDGESRCVACAASLELEQLDREDRTFEARQFVEEDS